MLFNSLNFAIFLPVVFILYWFVTQKSLKIQNLLLLVASYFFYACWNYKLLFLLLFSTLLGFITAIKIHESGKTNIRQSWLWFYLAVNLGLLGIFKYYNFFASSFIGVVSSLDSYRLLGFRCYPAGRYIFLYFSRIIVCD